MLGIIYGFQVMRSAESSNLPFTIFKTRFPTGLLIGPGWNQKGPIISPTSVRLSVSHVISSKISRQNFLRFCMLVGMDNKTKQDSKTNLSEQILEKVDNPPVKVDYR